MNVRCIDICMGASDCVSLLAMPLPLQRAHDCDDVLFILPLDMMYAQLIENDKASV